MVLQHGIRPLEEVQQRNEIDVIPQNVTSLDSNMGESCMMGKYHSPNDMLVLTEEVVQETLVPC